MSVDVHGIENAARLSMATFQESDAIAPESRLGSGIQAMVLITAIALPCLALLMYF